MKSVTAALAILIGGTACAVAQAQTTTMVNTVTNAAPGEGVHAGDFVIRAAFAGVVPLVSSSHIDTLGGHVDVTGGVQPEVDFTYFVTDNISVQLIATATRHEISARKTKLGAITSGALPNDIDLGSTYVLPPAIVAQYHFFPQAKFDPYVGAGIDFLWPFDTQENKYKLGGTTQVIQKLGLSNAVGPVIEVGLDYNISGPWFLNIDYKQIFNHLTARITTPLGLIKARTNLDPAVFSAGIAYRF